ncbi:hypothetical protein CERZMDRAFT_87844 [Cercospora zeae-maydis SCOH1-5]|uniref:Uncharacterized protein n=1 Tax=Cercospora zeae-maydis SCOH1-5 TaxID=717836 RepID=A0A6A6F2V6_9PEZI|nr:hypothetical protein CERZMDRAFT_87844 [Cercospora zeae-maydis SCOH1-5]
MLDRYGHGKVCPEKDVFRASLYYKKRTEARNIEHFSKEKTVENATVASMIEPIDGDAEYDSGLDYGTSYTNEGVEGVGDAAEDAISAIGRISYLCLPRYMPWGLTLEVWACGCMLHTWLRSDAFNIPSCSAARRPWCSKQKRAGDVESLPINGGTPTEKKCIMFPSPVMV